MKIQTHAVHFHARPSLLTFVETHLFKLSNYCRELRSGEVFLRVNNDSAHLKTVEISLDLPGSKLFASERSRTFEEATLRTITALRSQLRKVKTRLKRKA